MNIKRSGIIVSIPAGRYVTYLSFLSLIWMFAMAVDTASESNPIYQVQWQTGGIISELDINGITIDKSSSKFSGTGSAPLNKWLKPGRNVVTIRLRPLPESDNSGSYKVSLARAQAGQYVDEGEKVFEFSWESGKSKDKLPIEKKIDFTPQSAPALDLWTKAELITLDAGTEKSIRSFLKTLSNAYIKADADKIAKLQEFKAIVRFPNDLQIGRSFKNAFQALSKQNMIISQYNAVRGHYRIPPPCVGMVKVIRVPFPS